MSWWIIAAVGCSGGDADSAPQDTEAEQVDLNALADLYAGPITLEVHEESVTVTTTVENYGIGDAAPFQIDVWVGREDTPAVGETGDATIYAGAGIPAWGNDRFVVMAPGACDGCVVTLFVDSLDEIPEREEDNNIATEVAAR